MLEFTLIGLSEGAHVRTRTQERLRDRERERRGFKYCKVPRRKRSLFLWIRLVKYRVTIAACAG